MKFKYLILLAMVTVVSIMLYVSNYEREQSEVNAQQLELKASLAEEGDDPNGRATWELMRLADPKTGEIPAGIHRRELQFSQNLPQASLSSAGKKDVIGYDWNLIGPSNVGGRTRAAALDIEDDQIILAGGVSGGMWRSDDGGQSWQKTTAPDDHHSITCLAQDTRPGKSNIWYYGSGEGRGNSASKSFSAYYLGYGMYKSTDGGNTWTNLESTISSTPQTIDQWDRMWDIAIDPSNQNQDVVFAAMTGGIKRSEDGGENWTNVLGGTGTSPYYTDIQVTSQGVAYAGLSNSNNDEGIWRSSDGTNWTDITPDAWPSVFERIVIGIDPSDEDVVYFLAETPGSGQLSDPHEPTSESHNLWKYEYLTGDGAGSNGIWTDLTMNIPSDTLGRATYRSQSSYDMVVAVKPGDPNTIFLGGSNLFRSTDGFTSDSNITQIGGYDPNVSGAWGYRYKNHHPDQHLMLFPPSNPDVLISVSDNGLHRTDDCMADTVSWEIISDGYITSQFYTIAVDHGTPGSNVVVGGLQDNGTQWTNSDDPDFDWVSPNLGDGSFCAISDGAEHYYFSRQFARIIKTKLDENGEKDGYMRIDPDSVDSYLFINPFILDPVDNNVMYLAASQQIWRNNNLADIALDNEYEKIDTNWQQMSNIVANGGPITALAASTANPPHRLYYGLDNRRLYRVDDANTGDPLSVDITTNISSGGYTSCIAVDPRDADKVMVVYSNYSTYSLYYSINGGAEWTQVAGNLESEPPEGVPPGLGFGDGPSCRYAAIIPVGDETVFLVGTSIGLFGTNQLNGDSTIWVQQSPDGIGNVVVDMIDFRVSDGFVAVATHGNGVYTTHITDPSLVTGIKSTKGKTGSFNVYPNPVKDQLSIEFNGTGTQQKVILMDGLGRPVEELHNGNTSGQEQIQYDMSNLPSGIYFIFMQGPEGNHIKKVVKP